MERISSLFLMLIGVRACARAKGLKVRTVEMILLEMDARPRTREARLLRVAVTRSASLDQVRLLLFSCKDRNLPAVVLYNAQKPVEQTGRFGFQVRIRDERMISGHQGEGNLILIGPLMSGQCMFVQRPTRAVTHSRISDHARCLHLYYSLDELDTAEPHPSRRRVHPAENGRLDRRHFLPCFRVARVGYSAVNVSTIRVFPCCRLRLSRGLGAIYSIQWWDSHMANNELVYARCRLYHALHNKDILVCLFHISLEHVQDLNRQLLFLVRI